MATFGLHELDRWKVTELQQFVIHGICGTKKNVLSPERYKHFMPLSVAMSIMLESDEGTWNGGCIGSTF